jgi:hypothetical protein
VIGLLLFFCVLALVPTVLRGLWFVAKLIGVLIFVAVLVVLFGGHP